ncbi:MAG: PilN domain-containing protein [Pseudomonadota bacterium]|nr:PilN domain-containing protein [Pseudomonadota bacterium]
MIQQVNLYTSELRPRQQRLSAARALGITVVLALIIAGCGAWLSYEQRQLAQEVTGLEQQNARLNEAVASLSEAVERRQPDPELEAALQRISETLARRQRLLERVEGLVVSPGQVFSPQMAALARQIPENVWLTGIVMEARPQRIQIEGRSHTSAQVPLYLEQLGKAPAFTGRTFGVFRIDRPDEGNWVEFFVASEPGAGEES